MSRNEKRKFLCAKAIHLRVVLAVLSLMAAISCYHVGPISLGIIWLEGTWAGTITSSSVGAGNAQLTISQSGSQFTGTWTTTFVNPSNNVGGTLSGGVHDTSVWLTLSPGVVGFCPRSVTATLNATATKIATQMTGTFTSVSCSVSETGSIDLTKW